MSMPKLFVLFALVALSQVSYNSAQDPEGLAVPLPTLMADDECSHADGHTSPQCHVGLLQARAQAFMALGGCESFHDCESDSGCDLNSQEHKNLPGGKGICRVCDNSKMQECTDTDACTWIESTATCSRPGYSESEETGSCTIYGDPHIIGFDKASTTGVSLFSQTKTPSDTTSSQEFGDFWLVKSAMIYMQGRFNIAPKAQNDEQSWLRVLAVGGPFLKNNTLKFGTHNSKTFWNDQEILSGLPSVYRNEFISAKYTPNSEHVQDSSKTVPGIEVDLPLGVKLLLNRGTKQNLAIKITVPKNIGHLDGQCGNFNGLAADDTETLISQRMEIKVSHDNALIDRPARGWA